MKSQEKSVSFYMPGEWSTQAAIWLAYPHSRNDWHANIESAKLAYAETIRNICLSQRVRLLVREPKELAQARKIFENADVRLENVDFIIAPTNRGWLRDSGATCVYNQDQQKVLLDWHFNAWAAYRNWQHDDKVPQVMGDFLKLPRIQPMHKNRRIVLEGGSFDVNGKGALLTTEECLMSQDVQCRNKGFSKQDYEEIFAKYLGCNEVIWLGNGIAGDDTHGHVDDISRFVNEDTIVTVIESDKNDVNYQPLQENLKILKKTRYNIVELPMPKPVIFKGMRLPASYANFLITNNVVLVPIFADANDRIALNILAELFPDRNVVGIYCRDFVIGQGTIHCASQQEIA